MKRVLADLKEKANRLSEKVIAGNCTSYSDYREKTSKIAAYLEAIDAISTYVTNPDDEEEI